MPRLYKFNQIYYLTIATVISLAVGVLGTFWVVSEYQHQTDALAALRDDAIAERKTEVKTLINDLVRSVEYEKKGIETQLRKNLSEVTQTGWDIVNSIYRESKGKIAEEEAKQMAVKTLMSIRFFDGRGYFWIHDLNHTLIAHPFRKHYIGSNEADLTDNKGQKFVRSFITEASASDDGGFVSYFMNRFEDEGEISFADGKKKIAYVRLFKPYNWVIGAGEYVDDSVSAMQTRVIRQIASIKHGTKGYVFAHTSDGICLNHVKKENIGKNRWELQDAGGMKVVQALDRTGRQPGGGFLEYVGSVNPETGKPAEKVSFVQSIDGWDWVVGTGVYLTDIEQKILGYRQGLFRELRNRIITTLLLLLIVLGFTFLLARQLFHGLLAELNLFVAKSNDKQTERIDINQFRIMELRNIAMQANVLIAEKEETQAELHRAKRMESIGLMAGGVAHDLNNILSGIVGYPELLLASLPEDSEQRKLVNAIRESGLQAATVVADLLTVARGAASIRENHNLNDLVREYLTSPEYSKLKTQHPEVVCRKQLNASEAGLLCSPVHVKKCLMNLVVNAAESIGERGEIVVSTYNVTSSGYGSTEDDLAEGEYVVLSVCDSGPGISTADIAHIFEPFYTKKTMGRSGTGLGLTVVWNTMEDHNGKVVVENAESGAVFKLYFPLSGEQDSTVAAEAYDGDIQGAGERVLVIDDEPYPRDIARQMLTSLGYIVDAVRSGEEAIEFTAETPVDILVLDMLMEPGMNGCQTYTEILKSCPDQKAVVVSGFSESDDVKRTLKLGAGGFIKKPYSMDQLGRVVKEVLGT